MSKQLIEAQGTRFVHPIKGPSKHAPFSDEALNITLRQALGCATREDWTASGYSQCSTPHGESVCRCGAYALDWSGGYGKFLLVTPEERAQAAMDHPAFACSHEDDHDAVPCGTCTARRDRIVAIIIKEREALWLGHGCPVEALYGDDGEMQCGRCRLDFRRDPIERITASFRAALRARGA